MRVIIAGAGTIGGQLLADLTSGGWELVVIDTDGARCEELAERFDSLVLHGDASDPALLEKAQIGKADSLVAATGSDPVNTVIAMLAQRFGVERIVVKLGSNALRGALAEIGVTDVVAPTMAAAAMINATLQGVRRRDLELLAEGGLELEELQVGAPTEGHRVGDLEVPDGAMLVAVLHNDHATVARPDTELTEGDVVLVLAENEDAADTARRQVSGS
jgi:trk system potassium uptake protein TrkA